MILVMSLVDVLISRGHQIAVRCNLVMV